MATDVQQAAVAAYFTEVATPSVIGTTEGAALILSTIDSAQRVQEQIGKSRRLLTKASLLDGSGEFTSAASTQFNHFNETDQLCDQVQLLLIQLLQKAQQIAAENDNAKQIALRLGYTL